MNLGLCADHETYNQLNRYELKMKLKVTTTNITEDNASTLIDQFTFNVPEFIQDAITNVVFILINNNVIK